MVGGAEPFRLGRRPWLDGMRAFAVVFVVIFHERLLVPAAHIHFGLAGDLGVDVFFVISGFLITSLLLEEVRRTGSIGLGGFYSRRARRLLPALAVLLAAITIGAIVFASPHGGRQMIKHVLAAASYCANWVRAFNFHHIGDLHELGHTWSLAVEEQFYLIWPVTLLGLLAVGVRRARLAIVLGVLAVVAVLWRTEVAVHLHWTQTRAYNGFDTRSDGLLMGCTLAVALHHGLLPTGTWVKWIRRLLGIVGAVAVVELVYQPFEVYKLTHWRFLDAFAVVGLSTALIIWALIEESGSIAARALSIWPLRSLGLISYGIYLYSFPVTLLLNRQLAKRVGPNTLVAVHLLAILAVATLSYVTIESRFRRRRSADAPEAAPLERPRAAQPATR